MPPYDERHGRRRLGGFTGGMAVGGGEGVDVFFEVETDVVELVGGAAEGEPHLGWQEPARGLVLGEAARGRDQDGELGEDAVLGGEGVLQDLDGVGRREPVLG